MVYILGAGAMAREVISYYADLRRDGEVRALLEENTQRSGTLVRGKPVLDATILAQAPKGERCMGAMGSPLRRAFLERVAAAGRDFDTVIHPTAHLGQNVGVGAGTVIAPGAVATCDVEIGRHVIVNVGSSLNHDCRVGDFVTLGPGVRLAGNVSVGQGAWVGVGATVIEGVTIGEGAFIGAGAVVLRDVPARTLAYGVPARPVRELSEDDWRSLV